MKITETMLVSHDPKTVFDTMCDPDYVEYKSERAGITLLSNDVVTTDEGAVTVVTRGSMKSDVVPANFRTFVGSEIEIRQTVAWAEAELSERDGDGKRVGTFALDISGAPVRISGTVILETAPAGSQLAYSGEVNASIPLFGNMIEKAIAGVITDVLAKEASFADEWIARRG
jgi:hypothetical protein